VGAARSSSEAGAAYQPHVTDRSSGAADYAKIKASIADVLARIQPTSGEVAKAAGANAERAIVALMPNPVIVLPMPPTDPQIIAFVAQVAQSVAAQAAQARAAQAVSTPLMVEAATN